MHGHMYAHLREEARLEVEDLCYAWTCTCTYMHMYAHLREEARLEVEDVRRRVPKHEARRSVLGDPAATLAQPRQLERVWRLGEPDHAVVTLAGHLALCRAYHPLQIAADIVCQDETRTVLER